MSLSQARKVLTPGRVLTLLLTDYQYTLATVVQTSAKGVTVFMLCEEMYESECSAQQLVEQSARDLHLVRGYQPFQELHLPEYPVKHLVVNIPFEVVFNITHHVLDIEPTKIINDYKKRQIPRFR